MTTAEWGKPLAVVFLGGLNLLLIQWVLVRELTALLMGTELVVLLVSVMYFLGLSLGYGMSNRIPTRWLGALGVVTLVLHLSLPIWFRLAAVGLAELGVPWAVFLLLPLATPLVVSAFYSLFLPRYADAQGARLSTLYAVEIGGAAVGVVSLVALGGIGLSAVYGVYTLALLVILALLGVGRLKTGALAVSCAVWLTIFPMLNGWSNARWYEAIHDLPSGTQTLTTSYSAYQKVDVLQDPEGRRYLYLDGLLHFGTDRWSRLNVIMGAVSADLLTPQTSLVIGAGSMEMERMIAERGGSVTTVELDLAVVAASTAWLDSVNHMTSLTNRAVVIDDAKHYIANTDLYYDLVATDVPAAFSIQTATLYAQPFYEQIARRLTPDGVLVVNLTTRLREDNLTGRRIARSLLNVFDDVVVVTSNEARLSFAFAGAALPFDLPALQSALDANGESNYEILSRPAVAALAGDAAPITLDSMDLVLDVSTTWIAGRLDGR